MKKKLLLALVLLSSAGYLGYRIINKINDKLEIEERIKTIPDFSFFNMQGIKFTQNNLKNKPIVFVYFNSDCDYCQSEATKIQEHLHDFKNTQLVFVSFEKKDNILRFAKKHQLYNKDNVIFLEDIKGEFATIFDVNSIPYIVVYNANKKLQQKFKGATKVNKILEVLK
ncbi:redoxin domain-containing protein [uncultured Tenacibaculum sp.]|uniref:peroxiredoxin family protein n=1 Tax=uncultured Tenacibaculum sp. TaxID=174713 RepID=UPI0026386B6E|nr:redoxin domain-containing protein [uncultured Tenacibaculum sp.]